MSNDNDGAVQQTHQTHEKSDAKRIAELFNLVAAAGYQPRLRSVSGTCRFNIIGAGSWLATIEEGMPTVTEAGTELTPATCTVTCNAEDFLNIVQRKDNLNILAAYLQGLVNNEGDSSFASALLGSVLINPVGAHRQ